ncbi:MAG: fumarate reductase/succinate dehydrogenase flavoprotein subunit, partial [Candidatus Methanomethylicota archaeon]
MTSTDVLIIGGGAAGLRAAIEAARVGVNVIIASKAPIGYASSSMYAGGGFRAAFEGYTPERHFEETIIGGKFLNDQELVRLMVNEAPERLLELKNFGVELHVRPGGVYVHGDPPASGLGLVKPLAEYASSLGVKFIEGVMAIDLLVDDRAYGAVFYDINSGEVRAISAKAVVLATGGYSQLFLRNDNPIRVTGDGCAMALKAGANLIDMEFTQFFPLGLAEENMPTWLFPVVFGRLVNSQGEDILKKYKINVPLPIAAVQFRDLLSRAMWIEISEGRGVDEALIIEVAEEIEDNLKVLSRMAKSLIRILKITKRRVRVAPLAHFTMGGVDISINGETKVPGLYACGEVTGGVHGANRLGGNALTEAIVFGARAGKSAAEWAKNCEGKSADPTVIKKYEAQISSLKNGSINPKELKFKLKSAMWRKCGVIRNKADLNELIKFIDEVKGGAREIRASNRIEVMESLEFNNMLIIAEAVALSALLREESRGAHCRKDFPNQRDDIWLRRIAV